MAKPSLALPGGHRLESFESIDSTMSEAARRAHGGDAGPLWIWALEQTSGRGRSGRVWESARGNLFTSLLLKPDCPLATALQLSLIAGLATYDAVAELGAGTSVAENLVLKWPNDLLLAGDKIAGILLESFEVAGGQGLAVIIGTGLNLTSHPLQGLYPASDLAQHGVRVEPDRGLEALAGATGRWLSRWDSGSNFDAVREAWLERSFPLGQSLHVRLDGEEVIGLYAGIDKNGALCLTGDNGAERRISAGDVFIAS